MAENDGAFYATRVSTMKVEWKIKDFLNLPKSVGYHVRSPTFMLSGAEWYLRVSPNGSTLETSGHISLSLMKKLSPSDRLISYTIGIKKADSTTVHVYDSNRLFEKRAAGYGAEELIQRSNYFDFKGTYAPDGTLSVFCMLYAENCDAAARVEKGSQTSSNDITEVSRIEQQAVENSRCQQSFDTLSENFKELFLSGREGDVTIRVKNKEFVVHRLVLTTRSPVFRAMFELDMMEKNSGGINVDDCDPDSFQDFLLFLYSGKLDVVSATNALGLYSTAEKYDVKQLKEACSECLAREISVDSVCDVVHLATLHDETELLNTATQFFINNANKIVTTPKWLSFMTEHHTVANELLVKMTNKYIK